MSSQLLDATAANKGGDDEGSEGASLGTEARAGREAGGADADHEDVDPEDEPEDEPEHHEEDEKPEKRSKPKLAPEVQKAVDERIGKAVKAQRQAEERAEHAEAELEEARTRLNAEDAETVLEAAREAGVMPELLQPAEANGLKELNTARDNASFYARLLRQAEAGQDEFDVGGNTLTRKQVAANADGWEARKSTLERRFGHVEGKAREAALEVWRLGMKARKAGWKPGQKPAAPEQEQGGKPLKPVDERQPSQRRSVLPQEGSRIRAADGQREGADGGGYGKVVGGEMSLVDAIKLEQKQEQKLNRRG